MSRKKWKSLQEAPEFLEGGWMLYAADKSRRHKSSAGGAVSELTRYLMEKRIVRTALGFSYEAESLSYVPKWIFDPADVVTVGSIYHELALVGFLKQTINEIKPPLLMIALPCQIRAIRVVCKKAGIPVHIISLVCSGQLKKDATRYLFQKVAEDRTIVHHRYRGGGWPSGVRIKCCDGSEIKIANNNSVWSNIFHSVIFNPFKCFKCRDTYGIGADITVGDPWLPRYVENETEGVSMCIPQSQWAVSILEEMLDSGVMELKERIESCEVLESQMGTLEKKAIYRTYPKTIAFLRSLYRTPWYRKWVFDRNINDHIKFHRKCMNILKRI